MKHFKLVILGSTFLVSTAHAELIYTPFSQKTSSPPTKSNVVIADISYGLSTNKVCGYTTWRDASIKLPTEILNNRYWKGVQGGAEKSARDMWTNFTGVAPEILACYASQTSCESVRNAQAAGRANAQMKIDQCKLFDSLSDKDDLGNATFADCVRVRQKKYGEADYQAMENCSGNNKKEATEEMAKVVEDLDYDKFIEFIFGDMMVATKSGSSTNIENGKKYTQQWQQASVFKSIYPGIEFRAGNQVNIGGSSLDSVDAQITGNIVSTKKEFASIVQEMCKYIKQNFSAKETIKKVEFMWAKDRWANNMPGIYRYSLTGDSTTSGEIIRPMQLYMVAAASGCKDVDNSDMTDAALEELASASAYTRMSDTLNGAIKAVVEACAKDPRLAGVKAQKNCTAAIQILRTANDATNNKRSADEYASRRAQIAMQYAQVQAGSASNNEMPLKLQK